MDFQAMQAEKFKVAMPILDPRINADAWRALVRAAVRRAIGDAQGANLPADLTQAQRAELVEDARAWLVSADCWDFCHLAGMDFELIRRWARAGWPRLKPGRKPKYLL